MFEQDVFYQDQPPKLLVANRSEIACRIFQSCREMDIRTVGIVAPGDEEARHVTYADEVQSVSSYLDGDSILRAAQQSKADFIHPGYGFLSESAVFATQVARAGFVFIGPSPETLDLFGNKMKAMELAAQEGIPVLPWARWSDLDSTLDLGGIARQIGFPLILKPACGGGGKGMRRVNAPEELDAALESAVAESGMVFGNSSLFLQSCLEKPRHIEVQIFGDGRGNGIHLYERECTLQRRHQKIWEEAPAPNLSDEVREKLFESALKLIRATRYKGVGTVEFLVDQDEHYFFIEMNPRLQVEHAVTEMVTGVDLVWSHIMSCISGGNWKLMETPIKRGVAIEVRLCAENPEQDFQPTSGRIAQLNWPTGPGIRIDSGIENGQMIQTQFDSMLAKLIVLAPHREHALARLKYALEETVIFGVGTNQEYFLKLCQNPDLRAGKLYTRFLEENPPQYSAGDSNELDFLNQTLINQVRVSGMPRYSSAIRKVDSPWTAFAARFPSYSIGEKS